MGDPQGVVDGEEETPLGFEGSKKIWEALKDRGFIDKDGRVTEAFKPETLGFTLHLPEELEWASDEVIDLVNKCRLDKLVRPKKNRVPRKLNKELYWSEEFEDFWHAISRKTTSRFTASRLAVGSSSKSAG